MKSGKIKTTALSVAMFLGMSASLSACSTTASTTSQQNIKVKKIGTKRLEKAQSKKDTLDQEKKDKEKEYQKLQAQLTEQKDQEKQDKEQQEANKQQTKQESTADESSNAATLTNKGDLNTAITGKIIGNSRSHIYHVPGQAGYNMSSKNAVYFNSEQEAVAAGYRKAVR